MAVTKKIVNGWLIVSDGKDFVVASSKNGRLTGKSFKNEREALNYARTHKALKNSTRQSPVGNNKNTRQQLAAYDAGFKNIEEVKQFQRSHGLKVDGIVGKKTLAALQQDRQLSNLLEQVLETQELPKGLGLRLAEMWNSVGQSFENTVNDFSQNDPILGAKRTFLVGRDYGSDNPFRLGADAAGNIAIATAAIPYAASSIAEPILTEGIAAIPEVIALTGVSLASGLAGGYAWEKAYLGATGDSWYDTMRRAGVWDINQPVTNPGANFAAYYVPQVISNRGVQIANNEIVRSLNVKPDGTIGLEYTIEVAPGQTVTDYVTEPVTMSFEARPNFMKGTGGQSRYLANYTSKVSGAPGSSAGQGWHNTSTGGNRLGSVSNRVMSDTRGKSRMGIETIERTDVVPLQYTNTPFLYLGLPTPWTPIVLNLPVQYAPVTRPVAAPAEAPYRYQQVINPDARYEEWYGLQPEGTVQYYPVTDDPYHKAGMYPIHRVATFKPRAVYNVGGVNTAIDPDSTRFVSRSYTDPNVLTVIVNGATPNPVGPAMDVTGAVDLRPAENSNLNR